MGFAEGIYSGLWRALSNVQKISETDHAEGSFSNAEIVKKVDKYQILCHLFTWYVILKLSLLDHYVFGIIFELHFYHPITFPHENAINQSINLQSFTKD